MRLRPRAAHAQDQSVRHAPQVCRRHGAGRSARASERAGTQGRRRRMTGTLVHLFVAMLAFLVSHLVLSSRSVRDPLVAQLGERPFLGLYSLAAALMLAWTISAYIDAPTVELWSVPTAVKHVTLTVVLLSAILIAASVSPNNPAVA